MVRREVMGREWERRVVGDLACDDVADRTEPATAPYPVRQGVVHEDLPRHTEDDPRLSEGD